MAKKSKKYAEALSKIDRTRLYDATEALSLVAEVATAKSANMVALGAVVKTLDIITLDDAKEVIKMKMKPALVEANIKALEAGYDYVK